MDPRSSETASTAPSTVLPTPGPLQLEVCDTAEVTPSVRAITVRIRGSESASFSYLPGQDLALTIPHAPNSSGADGVRSTITRRYTIADTDPAGLLVLEILTHGDGPGARWAGGVGPGEQVEAFGPRGKITLATGVSSHLFLGDEASLPAIIAMTRALSERDQAVVVAVVAEVSEQRTIPVPRGVDLELHWIHREGKPAASLERVLTTLRAVTLDPSACHAYLFGEFAVVQAARRLMTERLGAERLSPKAYWRAGRPNAQHGEPIREQ